MSEDKLISTLIVEDMKPAAAFLTKCINARSELKLTGVAKNGQEALEKLKSRDYDLVFLDIHLPVMSGIEVLESLEKIPHIIFTTAYDKYAVRAFEFGAVDYLLKPFTPERFNQAVSRFLAEKKDRVNEQPLPHEYGLSFLENRKHYFLSYEDVIYLSSHKKNTVIHTEERDFTASNILKNLEENLPKSMFIRIHKQYIINLKYILNFDSSGGPTLYP